MSGGGRPKYGGMSSQDCSNITFYSPEDLETAKSKQDELKQQKNEI